jgi:exonuclease SbcD
LRFLHAADLHIDSPLRGLDRHNDAPTELIRSAPRAAFRRLIDLAKREAVDFVILAGDIFDGAWKDIATGLFFIRELERLAPTPVFMLLGNHDSMSTLTSNLTLPAHVKRFSEMEPQTFRLHEPAVALHGQSFATRVVDTDLAACYPDAEPGVINIGVLHTSLEGSSEHATYAPTSVAVLASKGYDAWCLGHIHEPTIVREQPLILYPGNIQGRHVKECGPRGCYIIDDASGMLRPTFYELDSLRWVHLRLELHAETSADELLEIGREAIAEASEANGGMPLCIRMTLSGMSCLNEVLRTSTEDFRGEMALAANKYASWFESVKVETHRVLTRENALERGGIMRDVMLDCERAHEPGPARDEIVAELEPLSAKIPRELHALYGTQLHKEPVLDAIIEDAEALLLNALAGQTL